MHHCYKCCRSHTTKFCEGQNPNGPGDTAQVKEGVTFRQSEPKKGRGSQLLYKRTQRTQNQFQKGEGGLRKGGVVIETLDHSGGQEEQVPKREWSGGARLVHHIYQWREGS